MGHAVLMNVLLFAACAACAVPTGYAFGCGDPAPSRGVVAAVTTAVALLCGMLLFFVHPIDFPNPPSRDIFILIATFFGLVGFVAEWTIAHRLGAR